MHETFNLVVEWINRAGTAHWNFAAPMFVQTAVLVGGLCVLEVCLRRRVRPVVRYWIWALVALKLLLPVTLSTPASLAYWLVPASHGESTPAAPIMSAPRFEVATAQANTTQEIRDARPESDPLPAVPVRPEVPIATAHANPTPVVPESPTATALRPTPLAWPSVVGWLFIAWFGGAATLAIIVLRRAASVRQLVRRAMPAPAGLHDQLKTVCGWMRLSSRQVRLKISDEVGCPAICGVWQPSILIPQRLLGQLSDSQFRLVFVHELSHWQRWDMQINLLQAILQIVYFYNPAVWLANSVLRRLREEAVDDAVLVASAGATAGYGQLLLDVAEQFRRPAELSLRMIGILESRKALVQRIRRMASTPCPKQARLGLAGFVAVAVTGLALVPMAAGPAPRAAEPSPFTRDTTVSEQNQPDAMAEDDPRADAEALATAAGAQAPAAQAAPLSGRIIDEEGEPVTDASVRVYPDEGGGVQDAKVDKDGRYAVKKLEKAGKHRIEVFSNRCLGISGPDNRILVELAPDKQAVRDFTLKAGCQIRIQTVDEKGEPIAGVSFFKPGRVDGMGHSTDKRGWVTIGGLPPSSTEYHFAARHKDFAVARLSAVLDDPKDIAERRFVLNRGIAIDGTVLCMDGKPAAGWRVLALPVWWNYMSSPQGELIEKDGSFVFPHIGPGPHKISLSIPVGPGLSSAPVVKNDIDLTKLEGPFELKVDFPSPGSMVLIEGEVSYVGGRPKQGFWIHADSSKSQFSGGHYLQPGEEKFRLGPVPPGEYRITINSRELEAKELVVTAPLAKPLQLELEVRGTLALRGIVVQPNGKPVADFRARIKKLRTLRGPNYSPGDDWQEISDPQGRFAVDVPGPGVYAVEATADGFAIARSDEVNTDARPAKELLIKLSAGKTLSGSVVDEQGKPIDGAVVFSLAKNGHPLPVSAEGLKPNAGVKTAAGKFRIAGLNPGKDVLHIVHPDYAMAAVDELEIKAEGEQLPLKIVMRQGRRLRGRVFDNDGRPAADVTLQFQGDERYGGPSDGRQLFATATTDENGLYEVARLPAQLLYVHRENEWEARGVLRQAVLPVDGKTSTVDFGGASKTTGRLLVNGAPLADKVVLLSGESPHFGILRAQALTDAEGRFTFRGIPAGEHVLYYPDPDRPHDWCRVQALRLTPSDNDLGTIDHRIGTLNVLWTGGKDVELPDTHVQLLYYDPVWFGLESVANSQRPQKNGEPFVFANLPTGKFALTVYRQGRLGIRQVVDFKAEQGGQTITLEAPRGTAAIRGSFDKEALRQRGNDFVELRSEDERLFVSGQVKDDATFEFSDLPAGDYFLTQQSVRNPDRLAQFSLRNGETKSIAISKATPQERFAKGFLRIRAFTSQGVLMQGCDVALTGPNGAVPRRSSQRGEVSFAAPPGRYQLSVGFPGFQTVRQEVELKPTQPDGTMRPSNHELNVTLLRTGE